MFRTRNMEKENIPTEQFVEKVRDLPVVSDALGKLGALYTGTKEHNRLFRLTLSGAESGVGLLWSTTKPVMKTFDKTIEALNGIACNQLDKLEQDYPIIAQPTDVVLKQTKETAAAAVKPLADRVKPITDKVGSATKYGVDKVTSAKDYTVGTIGGVANYGLSKVNDVKAYGVSKVNDVAAYGVNKMAAASDVGQKQMSKVLENHASQLLLSQLDLIMNVADSYVDKYLPPDASDEADKSSKNKKEGESKQSAVVSHAWNIGNKVRRRAYNRAAKELRSARKRSVDTISKMSPVDLLEYARTNLDGVREKVHYVWEEVNKSPEEVAKEETENEKNIKNLTYERRFIATARHLTLKIKAGAATLNLSIESVPGPFRPYVLQAWHVAQAFFITYLARPSSGPANGESLELQKSLPKSSESNSASPEKTPAKAAPEKIEPAKVTPPKVTPAEVAPEVESEKVKVNTKSDEKVKKTSGEETATTEKPERKLSSSSSEHQDDQAFTEPQEDSPDSYE